MAAAQRRGDAGDEQVPATKASAARAPDGAK
jgi:hypothetical protein